jgi:hypothetical protein
MKHLYLFVLEIAPLEVGRTYDELPSHLTLMSRFLSELEPEKLTEGVTLLFDQTAPILLTFGETSELGPKKVTVHHVHAADEALLHNNLHGLLDSLGVEYQYPEFIGTNHKAHVTQRPNIAFEPNAQLLTSAAYLIEVVNKRRVIRAKLVLGS